jgi:hypothetical protein
VLAVPSPATIVARRCSDADRQLGSAALIGVVVDANTEKPADSAEVVVSWTDYEIGTKSIASKRQRRSTITKRDGSYVVCGIPADLSTGVVARQGADSTAAVPVSFSRGVAIQTFRLPSPLAARGSAAARSAEMPLFRTVLSGSITDQSGLGISGARVAIDDDSAFVITNATGNYSLTGARPGTRAVSVRRIGFEPVEVITNLAPGGRTGLNVELKKFTNVLETVRVSAMRTLGLERVGFAERKRTGMGRYLSPEQLDRWNSPRLNDALRSIPSLRMGRTADGRTSVAGRFGDCVRYFVDGHLWSDRSEGPDTFLSGAELGAIEVYSPQFAPAEFMSHGVDGRRCNSVVIWTRWKLRIR